MDAGQNWPENPDGNRMRERSFIPALRLPVIFVGPPGSGIRKDRLDRIKVAPDDQAGNMPVMMTARTDIEQMAVPVGGFRGIT